MDPWKVKEIFDLKLKNIYPPNSTKNQRYVLKRRAESYCVIEFLNVMSNVYLSEVSCQCYWDSLWSRQDYAILQRYYWPGMITGITKWVSALFLHISVELMEIFTYFISECSQLFYLDCPVWWLSKKEGVLYKGENLVWTHRGEWAH